MQNILLECARRELSNGGVYLKAQVSWCAQRENFRVCWGRQLLSALPDFRPGSPSSRLDDTRCPLSSLRTLRPSAAITETPQPTSPAAAERSSSALSSSRHGCSWRHWEPPRPRVDHADPSRCHGRNSRAGGHGGPSPGAGRGPCSPPLRRRDRRQPFPARIPGLEAKLQFA